ncbi:hypothetical protein A2U01_0063486, partial [Trifolium medium]|nr:hypothetical protein [Trifolium medium]
MPGCGLGQASYKVHRNAIPFPTPGYSVVASARLASDARSWTSHKLVGYLLTP